MTGNAINKANATVNNNDNLRIVYKFKECKVREKVWNSDEKMKGIFYFCKKNIMKKFLKEALTFISILIYGLLFIFSLSFLYEAIKANAISWICILSVVVVALVAVAIVLFIKNKKFAKIVLELISRALGIILFMGLLFSIYNAVMYNSILWIILSVVILVLVALPIVLYIKSNKFKNYILKHKGLVLSGFLFLFAFLLSDAVRSVRGDGIMRDPILWNWIVGVLFAVSLIVAVVYVRKYIKIRDDNLKLQIEPHTMRNAIESIRVKIKEISKDINERMSDSQEDCALKSKINSLRYEMESACDFLSEIAEDNSHEKNVNTIYDELENVKKYLEFKTNGNLWNVSFYVSLNDNKNDKKKNNIFEIPSRITTPMIENAFKHGDVNAPDFLSISFMQEGDKYMIEIRNRILQDGIRQTRWGGLGIQNMKRRIELYSENIGSSNIALLDNGTDGDYYYSKLTFQNTRE